ncbi:MAG: sensor histidine kinase [Planctomycetaceae bacterium]
MSDLPNRVQQAIELQQTAIAGEIHDSLLPLLFAARMRLELLSSRSADDAVRDELAKSIAGIQEAMEIGRQLIGDLYPPDLEQTSWTQQIAETLGRVDTSDGTQWRAEGDLDELIEDQQCRVAARRIVQEAIRNAVRHGCAKNILVTVRAGADQRVMVTVEDDGRGFDPAKATRGYGLRIMDSRAKLINGSLEVDSRPGGPTRIVLTVDR